MGEAIWLGLLVAALAVELWAILYEPRSTLTSVLRRAFRVRSVAGAVVFGTLWMAGAVLLGTHVAFGWPW